MTYIEKELKLPVIQKTVWLDSQYVLGWIESKKSLATFIDNRIKEIKRNKDINFFTSPLKKIQLILGAEECLPSNYKSTNYGGMDKNGF